MDFIYTNRFYICVQSAVSDLRIAREMETAGKDAKTIKRATGWERGGDGKWRMEIPDLKIKREETLPDGTKYAKSEFSLKFHDGALASPERAAKGDVKVGKRAKKIFKKTEEELRRWENWPTDAGLRQEMLSRFEDRSKESTSAERPGGAVEPQSGVGEQSAEDAGEREANVQAKQELVQGTLNWENGKRYSLIRKPQNIADFIAMEPHQRPEKVVLNSVKGVYDIYKREFLGQSIRTATGHMLTFKPGHFFRLIAGTPENGTKGWITKASNSTDAIAKIEAGEIDFNDIAGFQRTRAENIRVFKDIVREPDFYYKEGPRLIFGKKYKAEGNNNGFLGVTLQIGDNALGILSFQPKKITEGLLKRKEVYWLIEPGSVDSKHSIGKLTEKALGIDTRTVSPETEKSSGVEKKSDVLDKADGRSYSLRRQVNPIIEDGEIRREYQDLLNDRDYTPERIAEWDKTAIEWIERQGGIQNAAELIANSTEHNDRHVATLVRRHVMNSEVFRDLSPEVREEVEYQNLKEGTSWGREGAARRLAAMTLDSIERVGRG